MMQELKERKSERRWTRLNRIMSQFGTTGENKDEGRTCRGADYLRTHVKIRRWAYRDLHGCFSLLSFFLLRTYTKFGTSSNR